MRTGSVALLVVLNSLAFGQESSALLLQTRIARPNVNGRMDHFGVDVKGQRLFVSAPGNHTVANEARNYAGAGSVTSLAVK
jgi:hypothetical protein